MGAAFVQSKVARSAAASTTIQATFDANVVAGNQINGQVSWDGGIGSFLKVEDNLGNSYTVVDNVSDGGSPRHYLTFYAKNLTNGGACTVTVTFTNPRTIFQLVVEEASGLDPTAPLDKHALTLQAAPGTGANGVVSSSVTPATDGQYVFGCSMATGSSTINYTGGSAVGLTTTVRNNLGTSGSDCALILQTGVQTTAAAAQVRATSDNNQPVVTGIMTFKAAAPAGPNITSVSSATPREGASLTITGTLFGSSQGSGDVKINGVAQTVTAWSNTSITVTVVLGTNKFGAAYNVVVRDNSLTASNSYAGITGLLPANSGLNYVNVGTPNADPTKRLTSAADAASGDQVEWDTKGGAVVVNTDLTFSMALGTSTFTSRLWTTTDGYGALGTQTIPSSSTLKRLLGRYGRLAYSFR